jgi:hypothetical protein
MNLRMKESNRNTISIMQDKSKFITGILDYTIKRKADDKTKERLINLISKEFEKAGIVETEINERLARIEGMLGGNLNSENKKIYETLHAPIEMVRFLHKFSIDENFKWFTHNPDNPMQTFDYENYLKQASGQLPSTPKININYLTYSNVRNFLFNNKDKEGNRYKCYSNGGVIKHTWSDIKEWCKNNSNTHPYTAEIEGTLFSRSIDEFKNVIEFRNDLTDLTFFKRVKLFINKNLNTDFEKKYTHNYTAIAPTLNVYIDTNLFFKGLGQILEWIKKNKAKSNAVEFSLEDNADYYQFEILHKNSYFSYDNENPKIYGIQGDFHKTREYFFGIIDWEILAFFKNNDNPKKKYKINCLSNQTRLETQARHKKLTRNIIEEFDGDVSGVKHVLKLYKTKL